MSITDELGEDILKDEEQLTQSLTEGVSDIVMKQRLEVMPLLGAAIEEPIQDPMPFPPSLGQEDDEPHMDLDLAKPIPAITELGKRFVGTLGGMRIFLVNGEFIRNRLETSFTMASHHWVSKYIPKDEVWVDDKMSELDKAAVIHHEVYEIGLMRKGMPYLKAHARATRSEQWFRKRNFLKA
jgi:hypothetical protein